MKNGPSTEFCGMLLPSTNTLPLSAPICWMKADSAVADGAASVLFRKLNVELSVETPLNARAKSASLPLNATVSSELPTPLKIVEGVIATVPPPELLTDVVTCGQLTLPMLLSNVKLNSVADSGVTMMFPRPPTDEAKTP